ncbi:MAG: hypothetical protein AB8C95_15840 [Phycisphaeraceae bacterium]
MKRWLNTMIGLSAVLLFFTGLTAQAQQPDDGAEATVNLLKDATTPQRDASHSTMLLSLRQLDDPALLPLFNALSNSAYLTMRIHGRLGSASLSPQQRIDLSTLAEIEDQRELVQVLSAAIDDELIDNAGMATLLTWDGLDLPLRQAIALRLVANGGTVDATPFRVSLDLPLDNEPAAAKLLQYALAALLLAESGDDAGKAALSKLVAQQGETADAVIGQTLDAAMRQDLTTGGTLGLTIAKDAKRTPPLRLLAIQSALRLGTPGATKTWQAMFREEQSSAQRIRLAMIALDAADKVEPNLFDMLDNQGEWIGHIAKAGRAIANKDDDVAAAFAPLITTGQPLSVQWVITHCQRDTPAYGPALLELVIQHHGTGPSHHRGRMTQAGIDAAAALCEHYPEQTDLLTALLNTSRDADLPIRQVTLMGIASARGDLTTLAKSLQPDTHNDFTTASLRLFIRARHEAPLTDDEWQRVSDIVQGVGNLSPSMRLQLGWAYLKHKGVADQAITKALLR